MTRRDKQDGEEPIHNMYNDGNYKLTTQSNIPHGKSTFWIIGHFPNPCLFYVQGRKSMIVGLL